MGEKKRRFHTAILMQKGEGSMPFAPLNCLLLTIYLLRLKNLPTILKVRRATAPALANMA